MQNSSASPDTGNGQSSSGSSRNNGAPAAATAPGGGGDDQDQMAMAALRQQDPPEITEPLDPPEFTAQPYSAADRAEETHDDGPPLGGIPLSTGPQHQHASISATTDSTAQFISQMRDRELQAAAMDLMGLEEIPHHEPHHPQFPPLAGNSSTSSGVPNPYPNHGTGKSTNTNEFISNIKDKDLQAAAIEKLRPSAACQAQPVSFSRRVSIDPPASIMPDFVMSEGTSSARTPHLPTAEATPIPPYGHNLVPVRATPFADPNNVPGTSANRASNGSEETGQTSANASGVVDINSEFAVRSTTEQRRPQDTSTEGEQSESSTSGTNQNKPPAFWELHKKKLICVGSVVIFGALAGTLSVVLGNGGNGGNQIEASDKGGEQFAIEDEPQLPKSTAAPSASPPTDTCTWVDVNIVFDDYPGETSWGIQRVSSAGDATVLNTLDEDGVVASPTDSICLEHGQYEFMIKDKASDGLCCGSGEGSYKVATRDGDVLAQGSNFTAQEITSFNISQKNCNQVEVAIVFDDYPGETSWDISKVSSSGDNVLVKSYNEEDVVESPTKSMCLEGGQYSFTIKDKSSDGLCCGPGSEGSYKVSVNGEVVAQGGEFKKDETKLFDVRDHVTPAPTSFPNTSPPTGPNPSHATPKSPAIITLGPTAFCEMIYMCIIFDLFPGEISWKLHGTDDSGTGDDDVVLAMYAAKNGETFNIQSTCLPRGRYRFTIYDSHGDGLGRSGDGQYNVTSVSSENGMKMVIAKGGNFGFNETTIFSIPFKD